MPRLYEFDINFEKDRRGTIDVVSMYEISPGEGLKAEGIERVPINGSNSFMSGGDTDMTTSSLFSAEGDDEYWLVSESNCEFLRSLFWPTRWSPVFFSE